MTLGWTPHQFPKRRVMCFIKMALGFGFGRMSIKITSIKRKGFSCRKVMDNPCDPCIWVRGKTSHRRNRGEVEERNIHRFEGLFHGGEGTMEFVASFFWLVVGRRGGEPSLDTFNLKPFLKPLNVGFAVDTSVSGGRQKCKPKRAVDTSVLTQNPLMMMMKKKG